MSKKLLFDFFAIPKLVDKNTVARQMKCELTLSLFLFPGCPSSSSWSYSGSFSSPNFPNNYPDNERCSWGITVPSGYRVKVEFHSFDLEQCCDHLYIYDGPSDSSPGTSISGQYPPCFFYSSGRSLWFRFQTDGSAVRQGFSATYTAVPSYGKCHTRLILDVNSQKLSHIW